MAHLTPDAPRVARANHQKQTQEEGAARLDETGEAQPKKLDTQQSIAMKLAGRTCGPTNQCKRPRRTAAIAPARHARRSETQKKGEKIPERSSREVLTDENKYMSKKGTAWWILWDHRIKSRKIKPTRMRRAAKKASAIFTRPCCCTSQDVGFSSARRTFPMHADTAETPRVRSYPWRLRKSRNIEQSTHGKGDGCKKQENNQCGGDLGGCVPCPRVRVLCVPELPLRPGQSETVPCSRSWLATRLALNLPQGLHGDNKKRRNKT